MTSTAPRQHQHAGPGPAPHPPPPGALLRLLRRHGFGGADGEPPLPPSSAAWLDTHPVFQWLAANLSDANFVSAADTALCEALLDAPADGTAADAALRRALEQRQQDEDDEEDEEDGDGKEQQGGSPSPSRAPPPQDALLRAMGLSPAGSSASSGGGGGVVGDDQDDDGNEAASGRRQRRKAAATKPGASRKAPTRPTAWLCGADDGPRVLEARVAARERAVAALEGQLLALCATAAKLGAFSSAAAAAAHAAEAAADDQEEDEQEEALGCGSAGLVEQEGRGSPLLRARRRAVADARRELERASSFADAELERLRAAARAVEALCQGPSAPARWLVAAADARGGGAGGRGNNNNNSSINNNNNSGGGGGGGNNISGGGTTAMGAYAREEARMRRRFERGIALLSGPTASVRRLGASEGDDGDEDADVAAGAAAAAAKTPAAAAAARGVLAARRLLSDGARHRDQERRNAELRRELARQRVAFRSAIARQVAARESLARAEAQADAAAALAEHLAAAAGGGGGGGGGGGSAVDAGGGGHGSGGGNSGIGSDAASVALLSAAAQAMVPALEAGNAARLEAQVAGLELERARMLADDDVASAAAALAAAAAAAEQQRDGDGDGDGGGSSPPAADPSAASSLRSLPLPALGEAVARLNDTHVLAGEYGRQLAKMEAAAARRGALVSALLAHGSRHLVLRSAQDAEVARLERVDSLLAEGAALARGAGERARERAARYAAPAGAPGCLAAGGGGGGGGGGDNGGGDDDAFATHAALLWDPEARLSAVASGAIDLRGLFEQAPGAHADPAARRGLGGASAGAAASAAAGTAAAPQALERAAREAAAALSRARADASERVASRLPELVSDAHAVVSALFAAVFPLDEAEEAARRAAAEGGGGGDGEDGDDDDDDARGTAAAAVAAAALHVGPRLTCPAVASTMEALAELNRELGAAVNDISKAHADRLAALSGGGGGCGGGGAEAASKDGGGGDGAMAAMAAARLFERRVWILFHTAPEALAAAVDDLRRRVQARERAGM